MRTLVVEKSALKQNLAVIKDRAAGAAIYANLSGNGGGLGTVPLARLLREDGITRFAVTEIAQAEALRKEGFVEEAILMLRSTTDREELERLVDLNVVCTISSVDSGMALNALAENRSTVAEAHIQVDTGMGLGGFLVSEPEKLLLAYRSLPNVALSGIYTQIHAAKPNDPETRQQLQQFRQVVVGRRQEFYQDLPHNAHPGLLLIGDGKPVKIPDHGAADLFVFLKGNLRSADKVNADLLPFFM